MSEKILVLSASLNPESRSRLMARHAENSLRALGVQVDSLDLRDAGLPFCDGGPAYADPAVHRARSRVAAADAILVAAPVYNYDLSAAMKNFLELTGKVWEDKTVGFLTSAGGASSYMSVMAFVNSLMLDFRCVVIPRFVYATGAAFTDGVLTDERIAARIDQLAAELVRFARALKKKS